jgi:hypothetical protein
MPDRDELDLLIDSAVSDYGAPQAGLEARILARIAEETKSKKQRWLPWTFALPVAAGVLLLLLLSGHKRTEPPLAAHRQIPAAQGTDVASAGAGLSTLPRPARNTGGRAPLSRMRVRKDRGSEKAIALPKLDVFPTPQPLSREEQQLVAFVSSAPEEARQSLVEAQDKAAAPLHIEAIQIQPLDSPGQGGN